MIKSKWSELSSEMSKIRSGKQEKLGKAKDNEEGPSDDDWMSILRMDKKFLARFEKKIRMKHSCAFPVHVQHPHNRMTATLRYLATGEGYDVRLVDMFDNTFECIFEALADDYYQVRAFVRIVRQNQS